MKNYGFERVYGADGEERVEIHQKNTFQHLRILILCLFLAFLFWILIVNIGSAENRGERETASKDEKRAESSLGEDGDLPFWNKIV